MRFLIAHELEGDPDAVATALVDPGLIARFHELPSLAEVRLLGQDRRGDVVRQRVWYRFEADLPPAVRAVVDPDRLSWTEVAVYDLASRTGEHRIEPEHYPDLLSGSYASRVELRDGGGSPLVRRTLDGQVRVRVPVLGARVERVIVDGLRDDLDAQTRLLGEWLRR